MLDMWASSILVPGFANANPLCSVGYRTGNGRSLGPLEKPIAERAVSLKRNLRCLENCLVSRFLVASDQERKPTQSISLILEAGHDFGWRCMIAGIDWRCAGVKPGHDYPLSVRPSNGLNGMGMPN